MENKEKTEIKTSEAGLLTVKQVADFLGARSTKWVYQHKHEIPGYINLAGSHFFHAETLKKHIEAKALFSKNGQQKDASEDLSNIKEENNETKPHE